VDNLSPFIHPGITIGTSMSPQPKLPPGFGDTKDGLDLTTDRAGDGFYIKHYYYYYYNYLTSSC